MLIDYLQKLLLSNTLQLYPQTILKEKERKHVRHAKRQEKIV